MRAVRRYWAFLLPVLAAGMAAEARAELVLSQVVVDLSPEEPPREDIEVFNSGEERLYVTAEPFVIVNPGQADQRREPAVRPDESGILVSPQKLVLEPGERRLVRVAAVAPRPENDRVYRVTIKPVAGEVSGNADAIKVLVGYDALVIHRPAQVKGGLEARRVGDELIIRNASNTSQELFEGKQCDAAGQQCAALPSRRLYPDTEWSQKLPYGTAVAYKVAIDDRISSVQF